MTREEKEKIIAEFERNSFDFEIFGRPLRAVRLDVLKIILNDISETESEIDDTTKDDKDCEHCARTYGTLGCCDTNGNKWVYSCKKGHEEYAKGVRKFEPTTQNNITKNHIADVSEKVEPTTKNNLAVASECKLDDCISRAELIKSLDYVCYSDTPWGKAQKAYIDCFKQFINHMPSVTSFSWGHENDCVPRDVVRRIIKSPRSKEQMLSVLESVRAVQPEVTPQEPLLDKLKQARDEIENLTPWDE